MFVRHDQSLTDNRVVFQGFHQRRAALIFALAIVAFIADGNDRSRADARYNRDFIAGLESSPGIDDFVRKFPSVGITHIPTCW